MGGGQSIGGGQASPPGPPVETQRKNNLNFDNVWENASQSLIIEADALGKEKSAFFNLINNKFYSQIKIVPDASINFPRHMIVDLVKFEKGSYVIGHENNNGGTSFTLTTPSNIWFGASICAPVDRTDINTTNTSCNSGSKKYVIAFKNPGTYTCSVSSLGTKDPIPGHPKICFLTIPHSVLKITNYPLNSTLTYQNEIPVFN